MSEEHMIQVVHEAIRAFNESDWTLNRSVYSENVIYEQKPTGETMRGYEAFEEKCIEWKGLMSDCAGAIGDTYVSGDWVILEVVWSGTHTGPMQTPMGEIAPSGNTMNNPGVCLYRIEDGKIVEIRNYFDMLVLLREFGALG